MRHHPTHTTPRFSRLASVLLLAPLVALAPLACAPTNDKAVREGYDALRGNNSRRALDLSAQQLQKTPTGPTAAEAYYLRGRALEQMPARTPAESASNLAAARSAYTQVLAMNPPRQLKAYTRASLGNVAFFQDDYALAAESFQAAYPDLDTKDARAWSLYRTGLSYQRLGKFTEADRYFARTQREFPGTLQARRSAENSGARAFYVRLGSYNSESGADTASTTLRRQGFRGISTFKDSRGMYLLRVGPYDTYPAARDARIAAQARFPDALIMP